MQHLPHGALVYECTACTLESVHYVVDVTECRLDGVVEHVSTASVSQNLLLLSL